MTTLDLVARARRYYDSNTERFLRFGQGGYVGAIHRSVWAPSVTSEREAFEYANQLVLERILARPRKPDLHVLDLGCGVGASLRYLAERMPMRGTGITISPRQVELARERLTTAGLSARVRVLEGSYLDLPEGIGLVDVAFSIEAFLHCPDADAFFAEASGHLAPGGLLMILDDFLADDADRDGSPAARRILAEFSEGWVASTLLTPSQVKAHAARHGFIAREDLDLSPYLECGRPRDRLISAFMAVARHVPVRTEYVRNFLGGNALQAGLKQKLIAYRFLVFEKAQVARDTPDDSPSHGPD